MKSWNIKRPWSRGLAMIMSFVMTISLLSGCINNQGPNPTAQTENTLDLSDTVVSGTTDSHSSVEYSEILSEEIIQEIHQINAELAVAAQAESEALETLSGVIEAGSLEDAKTALTAFTEKRSASEAITQTWLSIQEQAENEITAQVSQAAAQLLTQRAEALRNEITNRKSQTETVLESLEQALDSGDWEEAGTKAEELSTLLEIHSPQQTYGTGNNGEALYGTAFSGTGPDGEVSILSSEASNAGLLSLTGDTDINEDVTDLADELGTPLEIYRYLKNNIHYEYYYGSRKGANGTYAAYAGNDYDQASLLIGMLRYLGYEAEYVRGNIILEEEQALALTSTDTLAHAADVLASAGVPVTKYTKNGEVIEIQMEHVWVRALLPYTDYRGAGNAVGEALWIDLDTGIKAYESVDNIHDLAEETDLPAGLVQAVENGDEAAIESILNDYADTVDAMNPDTLYARKRTIKQEALSYLPASLQYKVEKELDTFSEISNTDKDSIRFKTAGESLGSYTTSELAGRNILLTFLPASPADEELLRSYDTIFDVPASGNISSLYESVVWEQLTGYESVSTLSILRKAKEQGIELLQINHDNLEVQMEKLNTDAATREAVRSAVTGGNIVTIPAEHITIGNWNGTGYIVLDPATGAGSYMISGGLNGGEIPVELTVEVMASAIMAVLGTATLITVLSASIFAVMFPVAAIAAYTALILITTVWIVDMYCSCYDYIGSGNLESYSDTELMAFQLFLLADADLMLSQFIFSYYTVPYLKDSGEDAGTNGEGTSGTKPTIDMDINPQQLGKKWGKHMIDYPNMTNYSEYEQLAKNVFNSPDKIIYDFVNGEYLYIQGNDLLRIKLNGEFVSLYPGAESDRVINAIERGGLLWEK